jgi:hypothetical protein
LRPLLSLSQFANTRSEGGLDVLPHP